MIYYIDPEGGFEEVDARLLSPCQPRAVALTVVKCIAGGVIAEPFPVVDCYNQRADEPAGAVWGSHRE